MRFRFKFLALVMAATLLTALPLAAGAQSSRLYFAGYMGLSTYGDNNFSESTTTRDGDVEFDNSFSLAGALGLRLTPQWRIEAEISRRSPSVDRADVSGVGSFKFGGDVTTWLYMLNAYYDIDWQWKNFQPFLTAGLGFGSHEASFIDPAGVMPNATDDSIGFAWSLGGGLKYRVNPNAAITTNYRYIGTSDLEVDSYDFEYGSHEFRLGLEYDMPADWLNWFK